MPRPARNTGTTTSFLPAIRYPVVVSSGVTTSTTSSSSVWVTSYAMSIAISSTSSRKSFVGVSTERSNASLCRMSGWSTTVRLGSSDMITP